MNPTIERLESEVRSYCRAFPTVFTKAEGAELFDEQGRRYLDFFAGAGTLNYGHNPEPLREKLVRYITGCGVAHGLDMATEAKCAFLEAFESTLLRPRDLDYRVMFPGPTGTNSVEAAIKLARKVTGRTNVISFTKAFHGMTLGALALTGNATKRGGAGMPLGNVDRMPFDGFLGDEVDTIDVMASYLADSSSGVDAPAAFIVETVQGEGGINVASMKWLKRLAALAKEYGSLLIVDDIQMGCGRTGSFFSFEEAQVKPDIVCLSKSISGFGLPFALTLFRPDLDVWSPGEHNGTFRGNNLAFVTATAAIENYWKDGALMNDVTSKSAMVKRRFSKMASRFGGTVRGRGFVWGLSFADAEVAGLASKAAFTRGVLAETAGSHDEVLKFLAPLTITEDELDEGLERVEAALVAVQRQRSGGEFRRSESAAPAADEPLETVA